MAAALLPHLPANHISNPMPDERLREVLPFLRPRSAEPTLFTQTVFYLLWIGLAVLVSLYVLRHVRLRQRRRQEFIGRALSAGLTDVDTDLLMRIAAKRRLKNPERLLSSAAVFERQTGPWASALARKHRHHRNLDRLANIRATLGYNEVSVDRALISTRQINQGQALMVWLDEVGESEGEFRPWLALHCDEARLTLAPMLREDASVESFRPGDEINVRFWREGDTEYRFHATIRERDTPGRSLDVAHVLRMERVQQRDYYRIHMNTPVLLYAIAPEPEIAEEEEAATLLREVEAELAEADPEDGAGPEEAQNDGEDLDALLCAATQVHGRVVNLSAGGIAVICDPGEQPPEQSGLWIVDPAHEGDFPLGGLRCDLLEASHRAGTTTLKMRFRELPSSVERKIVRGIYEHQVHGTAGDVHTRPGLPAETAASTPEPNRAEPNGK
ncbi:MAG: PilZ domain-containing protein [Candidatus Latescibacterota bacterium]|nr:PilZ domain-containing protein [Candidatus Latescibacterota bacterium]